MAVLENQDQERTLAGAAMAFMLTCPEGATRGSISITQVFEGVNYLFGPVNQTLRTVDRDLERIMILLDEVIAPLSTRPPLMTYALDILKIKAQASDLFANLNNTHADVVRTLIGYMEQYKSETGGAPYPDMIGTTGGQG